VHFIAMAGTGFLDVSGPAGPGPYLRNETLAMIVTLCAFVISSAFLLTGITFAPVQVALPLPAAPAAPPPQRLDQATLRLPFEREGRTLFVEAARLAAVEAEGHYTLLHLGAERLFCPWPITEAETRLVVAGFLRVHRGWLVNPDLVTGFERRKDGGFCLFGAGPKVPVARSRLAEVRQALGL
jgi:DNA-binding LytR/AlgR family response regulator